jgi:hypothetical protein
VIASSTRLSAVRPRPLPAAGQAARAEDQQRHRQRDHQQARQRRAAAQARGDRGDHHAERGQARRSGQQAQFDVPQVCPSSPSSAAGRQGGQHQRRAEAEPVGEHPTVISISSLKSRAGPLIEHALFDIRLDQPVERQDRGEQGRDPDHPAAGPRQHRTGPGADREGIEHGNREERTAAATLLRRAPAQQQLRQISAEEGEGHFHAA